MRPSPLSHDDPESVGGHRLLARLGAGGMGTVYLARTPTGRAVALKLLHADRARDPDSVTRFERETGTVRRLGGLEHVPDFVGSGTEDGRPWLATTYVVGPSLAEAVTAHGPWPERSLRALGGQLAMALGELHRAGVVHQDLKPSNVLLTATGPRLVDFGIARTGTDGGEDRADAPGTPAYMAPEHLTPEAPVGPPCDVFALGSVLTYAACGRPPFGEGEPSEVFYRITHQEPELDDVPAELRPLLAKCLAKDAEARPTAADLADLAHGEGWFGDRLPAPVLADLATRTAHVGEPPPPRAPDARLPARLTRRRLLTGAAAVTLAGAGAVAWATRPDAGRRATAAPARTPSPSRAPGAPPPRLWDLRADFAVGTGERPALLGGTLLVPAADDRVHGVDARRGTLRWTAELVGSGALTACGTAAVVRSVLRSGRLAAVEATDGRVWYSAPLGISLDLCPDPVFAADDRAVYLVGHDPGTTYGDKLRDAGRHLLAYDVTDRRPRWRRRLPPSAAERPVGAVADGVLLFLENDSVTAHRTDTGARLWRRELSTTALETDWTDGLTDRTVTAGDGVAFVAGRGCLCLDLRTGRTRWSLDPEKLGTELKGKVMYGGATIDGPTVYLTLVGQDLMAVRTDRRKPLWTWDRPGLHGAGPAPAPLLAGGYVFPQTASALVPAAEDAIAVDPRTHRTAWTLEPDPDDSFTADARLLADDRALYVLRGNRLRAVPLI